MNKQLTFNKNLVSSTGMQSLIKRVGGNTLKRSAAPTLQKHRVYTPLSEVIFNKYDQDGDGSLSFDEFKEFTMDKGYFFSEEELVAGFSKIDVDGSGDITYDEFKQFWEDEDRFINMKLTAEQSAKVNQIVDTFRYFDEDKNGTLDAQEFKNLFLMMAKDGFNFNGYSHERVYGMIDINNDGKIEFTELLRFLIEKFGILGTVEYPSEMNGELSYEAFKQAWEEEAGMKLSPQQSAAFDQVVDIFYSFDEDNDGSLNFEEYGNLHIDLLKKGYDFGGYSVNNIFRMIDVNGDEVIEFIELLQFLVENFDIMDTQDSVETRIDSLV